MTNSELYYFVGKCLAMDADPEAKQAVKSLVLASAVSWEDFVWMGSSHMVLPALYTSFKRNELLPFIPADLSGYLADIHALNYNRNQRILEQSHELIRILNGAGIEPVFLKGAGHLLQGLYYDAGDRIMSDIDILLSQEDIPKAAALLYENGYFHPDEFKEDNFEKHHHLPGFEHKSHIAIVEIHHALFPGKYSRLLPNNEVFSGKRKLEGMDAWVLSCRHQMVLNFVHDQLVDDGFKYKAMVIKGLYDFYLMAKMNYAEKTQPWPEGYKRKFNSYSAFVSATFNNSDAVGFTLTGSAKRFRNQFNYLQNHPKTYGIYQLIVLYQLRFNEILKVLLTLPFSKQSRRYFHKKLGTTDKAKKYFRHLKSEFRPD